MRKSKLWAALISPILIAIIIFLFKDYYGDYKEEKEKPFYTLDGSVGFDQIPLDVFYNRFSAHVYYPATWNLSSQPENGDGINILSPSNNMKMTFYGSLIHLNEGDVFYQFDKYVQSYIESKTFSYDYENESQAQDSFRIVTVQEAFKKLYASKDLPTTQLVPTVMIYYESSSEKYIESYSINGVYSLSLITSCGKKDYEEYEAFMLYLHSKYRIYDSMFYSE